MNDLDFATVGRRLGMALNSGDLDELAVVARLMDGFETPMAHAAAAQARGTIAVTNGTLDQALGHFDRAERLYRDAGKPAHADAIVTAIGNVYFAMGDHPRALAQYQRSMDAATEIDDWHGVAIARTNMGVAAGGMGDHEAALAHHRAALPLHEQHGNAQTQANATGNVGMVLSALGRVDEARDWLMRAVERADDGGFVHELGSFVASLVGVQLSFGRVDDAAELLRTYSARVEHHAEHAIRFEVEMARVERRRGDLEAARRLLQNALHRAEELGSLELRETAHLHLREVAHDLRDLDAYVLHNEAHRTVVQETRGIDAQRRMAMQEARARIEEERRAVERHRAALYSTLPRHVADRIVRGETVNDHHAEAAVLFLDLVGFTAFAAEREARDVVNLLETVFAACDEVATRHGLTTIKTIGDAYLAVAGIEDREHEVPPDAAAARAALDMIDAVREASATAALEARVGVHVGPLVAGVLGRQRRQFDVWGDTVNLAARLESSGAAGRLQTTADVAASLTAHGLVSVARGPIELKGKGTTRTCWIERG